MKLMSLFTIEINLRNASDFYNGGGIKENENVPSNLYSG